MPVGGIEAERARPPTPGTVGVLAVQGAVGLHTEAFQRLGVAARAVRVPADLEALDALVIPGGETTTISMLCEANGLTEVLRALLADGLPALGTCAGMIMLATELTDARADQVVLHGIDLSVRRNGFGRQVDSFEADIDVEGLDDPSRAVFVRAPVVERVGPSVEVLARLDGAPVLCRQGSVLVSAFHPELTDDLRLHELFWRHLVSRPAPRPTGSRRQSQLVVNGRGVEP